MRTWKLPAFTKVADKLKSTLLGEMASAEWELLEKAEWDDSAQVQPSEEPPAVPEPEPGPTPGPHAEKDDASHVAHGSAEFASHGSVDGEVMEGQGSPGRQKGTSGWMKLRSR